MNIFKNINSDLKKDWTVLDIGSSKILCAVGSLSKTYQNQRGSTSDDSDAYFKIKSVGHFATKGFDGRNITDYEAFQTSLLNAIHNCEEVTAQHIDKVYINIPNPCVISQKFTLNYDLNNKKVEDYHLDKLITIIANRLNAQNQKLLHIISLNYELDGQKNIKDPRRMTGQRLSAHFTVLATPKNFLRNVMNCLHECRIEVLGYGASSYLSSLSTLGNDEKDLGCLLLDVGDQSIGFSCFSQGNLIHNDYLSFGAGKITYDIARVIGTPLHHAERLKTLFGSLLPADAQDNDIVVTPPLGEKGSEAIQVPKSYLMKIISARVEDLLESLTKNLERQGALSFTKRPIILTGGGAQLLGLKEHIEKRFKTRVRIGYPKNLVGSADVINSPIFSTCAGLFHYVYQDLTNNNLNHMTIKNQSLSKVQNWFRSIF